MPTKVILFGWPQKLLKDYRSLRPIILYSARTAAWLKLLSIKRSEGMVFLRNSS